MKQKIASDKLNNPLKMFTMRIILMLVSLMVGVACNKPVNLVSDRLIDKLSKTEENGITSRYGFMMLFVSVENNLKAITDIAALNGAYMKYFKHDYKSFREFLLDALNQRISFSKKHLFFGRPVYFAVDKKIETRYHDMKDDEFIKYYVVEVSGEKTLDTAKSQSKSLLTILYYLFISNQEITFDDYIGRYYFREM